MFDEKIWFILLSYLLSVFKIAENYEVFEYGLFNESNKYCNQKW